MGFTIGSNAVSGFANLQLQQTQDGLASSLEKISSGKRINRAADDASGMTIANNLKSQAMGMGQSLRNVNDSVSMIQVAEGALGESTNILQGIREMALQASNDSQSPDSRAAIQADIDKSLEALGDIANNTSYNGQKLLSGNFADKSFQVGSESGQTASLSINDSPLGGLAGIDVTTAEGAGKAIELADEALAQIDTTRAELGSSQGQLQSTAANLSTSYINTFSAESSIRDVDIAEESINLKKMENLSKAGIFARAQANTSSKNVLNLLQ